MKKIIFSLILSFVCLLAFSGCSKLDPATTPMVAPTAPAPTEKAPHEHNWTDASCEAPKTCSVCGLTEGVPLAHSFGSWSPNQNEQIRTCQICNYQQTTALDLDDYYDIAFTTLSAGWDITAFPDEFSGLSENTKKALSLGFTVENGTLFLNKTPIYTFEWELKLVSGWSYDDSTAGLTIDLNTTLDGSTLVLDGQEFTFHGLTLSVVTKDPTKLMRPSLNMLISSNEAKGYANFGIRISSVDAPETYLEKVSTAISRDWYYGSLPNENYFISDKALNDLSLVFEGTEGVIHFDGAPIYTFNWKLDSIDPWSFSGSQGFWANLSISSTNSKLVLEDTEIVLQNIVLSVISTSNDGNYHPVLNLFVTVSGHSEVITFYMDTNTYNLDGYQEMTEKALSGSWVVEFHPHIEYPLSQNTLEHLSIHLDGTNGRIFYDGTEVYNFEWTINDVYSQVDPLVFLSVSIAEDPLVLEEKQLIIKEMVVSVNSYAPPVLNLVVTIENQDYNFSFSRN